MLNRNRRLLIGKIIHVQRRYIVAQSRIGGVHN
ncbi:Uncharacterised protein [Vibrio cholerae]|nr:Uncharacterised protein [Vibrio cholerae]